MCFIQFENSRIETVSFFTKYHTTVDVLRLDVIHPVIAGNKWYKLKEYLSEALRENKKGIITFGGAFSNHIVATAAASHFHGLKSIGIIRGERPATPSHTLTDALSFDMDLFFVSREDYKTKKVPEAIYGKYSPENLYFINEGGYGPKGMEGAQYILDEIDATQYTHIVAAVGTGTMLAGLTAAAYAHQKVIGISVLKNNFSLQQEIEALLPNEKHHQFHLLHDYHFGGYAKSSKALFHFMNEWFNQTHIPSDFVYTGKLFFAVNDLIPQSFFPTGSKILIIHSGGLQGNRSLPKGTLIF
jgi:1-aminocyclopropane-1-carboxylate deaminase